MAKYSVMSENSRSNGLKEKKDHNVTKHFMKEILL